MLSARESRALKFDSDAVPTFSAHDDDDDDDDNDDNGVRVRHPRTAATSDPNWRCAPIPDEIRDRRVEITGPVDRKTVINGLHSGADV